MKRLAAFLPLLLLVGCAQHQHRDLKIFRYNESAGIATLDPAFAKDLSIIWPCHQIYNGLVQLDSTLTVAPSIAKRWTISDDGLTYTFTLRDDVHFQQPVERTVVASDFLYSFGRITDPSVASPGAWILANVDTLLAPNDSTFIIRLKTPFSPFLSQLAMVYCSVVPREEVERWGKDFREHPCGTGPFYLQYWKEGVKMVLRRNTNYFERDSDGSPLPYLDAVAITFIVDKQTAFLEFIKGKLDFLNSIDASYKDQILTREGNLKPQFADRIVLQRCPYLNTEYLGFMLTDSDSPLANVKVRQAINYGFDRRKMMTYLRNNIGTPGEYGFVPQGLPGAMANPVYTYDPERARQLLAEAGYPDGRGLPSLQLSTTASYLDLCKYIQQQLGLIGIDVKVDVNPPAALREHIAQGKVSWFRGSWVADYPDAENYLSLFYSPNRAPIGPNYTRFANQRYDRLYRETRQQNDPDSRIATYQLMDSLAMAQAPVVVLYYDQVLHFTHKRVHGLSTDPMNTLDLRRVDIDL